MVAVDVTGPAVRDVMPIAGESRQTEGAGDNGGVGGEAGSRVGWVVAQLGSRLG